MGGELIEGRDGHAGEFGHLSVDPLGPVCACGARGCLEALVSRAHLVTTLALEHPDDEELEAALIAADHSVTGPIVAAQFAALRVALRTIATMVNPELIVLGGYLATLWGSVSADDRRTVLAGALPAIAASVRIEPAALGAHRMLIGAGELAWADELENPLST